MFLATEPSGDALLVRIRDDWRIENVRELTLAIATLEGGAGRVKVDFSGLGSMDLSGAWLLKRRLDELAEAGARVDLESAPEHFQFIDEMLKDRLEPAEPPPRTAFSVAAPFSWIGRGLVQRLVNARHGLVFFGRLIATGVDALGSWRRLRLPSVVRHVYETGIQAIPIVSLIALLISIIVAYLGAQQLQKFGAEIFTVDLVAIAVLREMGVLLTAIIVAGRSGSAFAAEIGVMKLNEEVDALRSMGFDPFQVLVLPRVLALLVALPLLTIIADAMGLLGGGILSALLIDIRPEQYISRVQDSLSTTTFWAGLVKAPVFAIIIALVGTQRGMEVRDSSRELGRLTTMAVVQSIFMVIFADAVFAVVFVQMDF